MVLALAACAVAHPATAAELAPLAIPAPSSAPLLPQQVAAADRPAFQRLFAALRTGNGTEAKALLDAAPAGPLADYARARLLAQGTLPVDSAAIAALLRDDPALPDAPTLAKLAGLGAGALPAEQRLVRLAGPSKRARSRPTPGGDRLERAAQPLLRAGSPASAEPLIEGAAGTLPAECLTEWRYRLAWAYYQAGDDASARRVATLAQTGAGEWSVDAAWVNGLAAYRAGAHADAAIAFSRVGSNASEAETAAAGRFWAARAFTAAGQPERAKPLLEGAAAREQTFYGLLAAAMLGRETGLEEPQPGQFDALLRRAPFRTAAALVEIGETDLADALLRRQARIGSPAEHGALIAFTAALHLPATQVWLAQNAPAGAQLTLAQRYPLPAWSPTGGWRVDRALVLAHALQESEMRVDAVSPAGARGLMQLMPATARLVARHRGESEDVVQRLSDPALNFEYGQSYLQELADSGTTGGLLPKVIAAYNAGPNAVARWATSPAVAADPLLFIESIPYAETRGYVAIVLRNYWIYQRRMGVSTSRLANLARGEWPRFPVRAAQVAGTGALVAGAN
ncbi:transglycosylase SLT domain-containing protein [Sphingomonas sp.]|uniref:lytic transglycosylase domain-containing protein n=1 Tax=Sphingomonas sp. TaxID=28214 RepID=UPI003B3A534F